MHLFHSGRPEFYFAPEGEGGGAGAAPGAGEAAPAAAPSPEAEAPRREAEQLAELEALKAEAREAREKLAEVEERSRRRVARAEVLSGAAERRFHDGEAAFLLVRDRIEFDAAGEPRNVAALLEELAAGKPWMVRPAEKPGTGSPANPAGSRAGGRLDPSHPPSWSSVFKRS